MQISTGDLDGDASALRRFDGRDCAGLSDPELLAFMGAAADVRKRVDVLISQGAAETRRRDQERSRADGLSCGQGKATTRRLIADTLGASEAEAQRHIDVGAMLANADPAAPVPAEGPRPPAWRLVAAAVRQNRLSRDKAAAIVAALETIGERGDAELEPELVAKGEALSLRLLQRALDAAIARLDREGLRGKQVEQHRARHLRLSETREGMTRIAGELDPVTAAPVRAFFDRYVSREMSASRGARAGMHDTRTRDHMHADALATLARHLLGCEQTVTRPTSTVVVRTTVDDLASDVGLGESDQLTTPLSGAAMRAIGCAGSLVRMLRDARPQQLDVGYAKPYFTPAQRLALAERDGGCVNCHAPLAWCEAHHIEEREKGGRTDLSNGAMLCTACHHRLHRDGWQLRVDGEHIWVVPPRKVDPHRTPILGGRAALAIAHAPPDPVPRE